MLAFSVSLSLWSPSKHIPTFPKLVDRMLQALVHRLWLMRLEVLDAPTWELFLVDRKSVV